MALPKYPTEQFPSSHFLICGGSILFESTRAPLRVCLLHHNVRDEWLLPKGRKDRGEDVTVAATKDAAVPVPGSEEPFMLTLRRTEDGVVKFIWWFATVRTGENKVEGTQTAVESFKGAASGDVQADREVTGDP
ncbi:hypothetical protein EDB85DRAFT_2291274 [Lactarius pseudohatsudake]|nr:hypothetical protein EDB85DRAFT_2291274 [Lactarius pseudohatsudake]